MWIGEAKMKKNKILGMLMGLCMLATGSIVSAASGHGTMRDITPAALAKEMTAGWNLGNSLDAYGAYSLNNETYWGNPKTTKAMIDAVKNQGFNTIRIPVSWAEHVGSAPNYTINAAWMNRVQEVVDYAMSANMYVLLDTHHETSWLKPQSSTLDASKKQLTAIWTQIAERFKDYGDHLIFEGMNEPRIVGSSSEWTGGDADGRAAVNVLNEAFIDAVRKTGGNNAKRCLIICPYGNNGDPNGLSGFKIPSDKNIMVAIHAYTPYGFTFRPEGNPSWARTTWDGSAKSDIEYLMTNLNNTFVSKGITVIITEFGAVNKNNESEVVKWVKDYVGLATQYGIKCVWWDNNYHKNDGESFGILDRNSCTWTRKSVADAVIKYAGPAISDGDTQVPDVTPITNYATLNDGWYYIKNTGSQKYLQVKDNIGANGQNVEISTGTGVAGQKWQLVNKGEGYVTLKNGNGFMLDVASGKDENGTNIQTYEANNTSAQLFKVLPTSQNGVYGIVLKCTTDTKGLDVVNKAVTDGANVQAYTYYGATNQTWIFESCTAPGEGNTQNPPTNPETPTVPEVPQTGDMIKVKIISDWTDGATAEITVTNLTGKALNGWTCTFTTNRPITSLWSAKLVSQNGNTYTISNPDWQPNLAPGASYTFGCNMGSGPSSVTISNASLK